MNTVFSIRRSTSRARRQRIVSTRAVMVLPRPTARSGPMAAHGTGRCSEGIPRRNPRLAQYDMPVEDFAGILIALKPAFIHHPDSWATLAAMLVARGCDPERRISTFRGLRISTSDGYLTSGVAYAHHPAPRHLVVGADGSRSTGGCRSTTFDSESAMAFHPRYWNEPTVNDSARFNYRDWNGNQRKNAAQHVTTDTRWQPHALRGARTPTGLRLVCAPGRRDRVFRRAAALDRAEYQRHARATASTSGPSTSTTSWTGAARRTRLGGRPVRRCAISSACWTGHRFPRPSSRATAAPFPTASRPFFSRRNSDRPRALRRRGAGRARAGSRCCVPPRRRPVATTRARARRGRGTRVRARRAGRSRS